MNWNDSNPISPIWLPIGKTHCAGLHHGSSIPSGGWQPPIHGFLQAQGAARLGGVDCPPTTVCDWPFNEQRLGLFAFWGVSEEDGHIIPSMRYAFSDALWGEVGANLFVGNRNGQYGALGDNDNIYATLRYAF